MTKYILTIDGLNGFVQLPNENIMWAFILHVLRKRKEIINDTNGNRLRDINN